MKCFTPNKLLWINILNSDNMKFKFKEPHKETKEIMAKVAQGENPYTNIMFLNVFHHFNSDSFRQVFTQKY